MQLLTIDIIQVVWIYEIKTLEQNAEYLVFLINIISTVLEDKIKWFCYDVFWEMLAIKYEKKHCKVFWFCGEKSFQNKW